VQYNDILTELNDVLDALEIPVTTGVFSDTPPPEYMVITPLSDRFGYHADDKPEIDIQEVRLSLFCRENYTERVHQLTDILIVSDFTITDRKFVGYDTSNDFYHYSIDVEKYYGRDFCGESRS
jgi:hypothetical protein